MGKNKIIYITTALKDEDFNVLIKEGKPINPAGQNFHARLIGCLERSFDMTVISLPPAWSNSLKTDNGIYHYSPTPKNKLAKYFVFPNKVISSIEFMDAPVVVYDSMNVLVSKIAGKIARSKGLRKVAILTDNPQNITGVSSSYIDSVFEESKDADGFIALSESLVELFGGKDKPHVVFEGLLDDKKVEPLKREKPYFYFGGALFERYGVKSMISAFMASKADYQMVIAGHGALEKEIDSLQKIDTRIVYLGQVSKETNLALENGASLLINPRPYSEELDKHSVPSKMIEYLATGNPILSTAHSVLKEKFEESINWIDGNDVEKEMFSFFKSHLNEEGHLINLVDNNSKDKLKSLYSSDSVSGRVFDFISKL
ncbi:MAG: glycosyltransferase [Bacilli bacterium]|nr:glycosyltransferase [Bacilli bacterium]